MSRVAVERVAMAEHARDEITLLQLAESSGRQFESGVARLLRGQAHGDDVALPRRELRPHADLAADAAVRGGRSHLVEKERFHEAAPFSRA